MAAVVIGFVMDSLVAAWDAANLNIFHASWNGCKSFRELFLKWCFVSDPMACSGIVRRLSQFLLDCSHSVCYGIRTTCKRLVFGSFQVHLGCRQDYFWSVLTDSLEFLWIPSWRWLYHPEEFLMAHGCEKMATFLGTTGPEHSLPPPPLEGNEKKSHLANSPSDSGRNLKHLQNPHTPDWLNWSGSTWWSAIKIASKRTGSERNTENAFRFKFQPSSGLHKHPAS